jgi:type IV secretion system protein VirB11
MNYNIHRAKDEHRESLWGTLPRYLRQAAEPIRAWLQNPDVVEICANRPGEVWVEQLGVPHMLRFEVAALTQDAIQRIAEHVAGGTHQSVNEVTPLLSAAMPHGERFQGVLSPATPHGGVFSIRKQVISDLTLEYYEELGGFENVRVRGWEDADKSNLSDEEKELSRLLKIQTPHGVREALRFAVENHFTAIISGGTSSGKTTFLNALLKAIPETERVISIEDTPELKPPQPNWCSLIASKGDQGRANVTIQSLLEASLRLRPDRLFVGEIRGGEAYTFLQAVNTGHPGSLTTLHANSTEGAFERLALATLEAGRGLSKSEIDRYTRFVVPVVVQLRRRPRRGVAEIYFNRFV